MRRLIVFAFLVVGVVGGSYAQFGVPKEVIRFAENYIKDSAAHSGENRSGMIRDSSIQIQDLRVGRALEIYDLKQDISLDTYPDTVPFSEIIESTYHWLVLIMAHGKPIYELVVDNSKKEPAFAARRSIGNGIMWNLLSEIYPESTGINPVFFSRYRFYRSREAFLYFKQKGPRRIYYLGSGWKDDPLGLGTIFTASMSSLDDSKKLLEYLKKPIKAEPTARELYDRIRAQEAEVGGKK
ncbi:MAG: hypothetical protein LBI42_15520 [Chitinispirillales bacterium]|jgi:hypothetical protein|nr:hypothetical protein [Chitinispirillales bacterium]